MTRRKNQGGLSWPPGATAPADRAADLVKSWMEQARDEPQVLAIGRLKAMIALEIIDAVKQDREYRDVGAIRESPKEPTP